ncbi:porin [bacterium]|nr:porin [bacterium]
MNKFKKIGLSALAGSLVAMSASAYEITMSGGASVAATNADSKTGKTGYYMNDSITFTVAGETDSGLSITTKLELDGGANASSSFDNRSLAIAHDELGTVTFSGHGGDSVMSGWDDVMPTAYEESFGLTTSPSVINGVAGDNLWRYDSPSFSGLTVHASYQSTEQTGSTGAYSDVGVQYVPEMVEGLSLGWASGEVDESTSETADDVTGIDETTMWVKYTTGGFTLGYQTSEADGSSSTQDDDSTSYGISYAVSDSLSISYGEHEMDLGSSTSDQNSSGVSASYTTGGVSIKAAFNETENVGGVSTTDVDNFEVALVFAF